MRLQRLTAEPPATMRDDSVVLLARAGERFRARDEDARASRIDALLAEGALPRRR